MKRQILGLTESITLFGKTDKEKLVARIDTGATMSSVDTKFARELNLGPAVRTKIVKSAHGKTRRDVVKAKIKVGGKIFSAEFSVADRAHMKYKVLIGQNILKKGFLIDPLKK